MAIQSRRLQEFSEYRRIAGIDQIGRRYLAMNAFDGILTMLGVLMGSYIAGITDHLVVVYTGLATSVAMGVSGLWGAYMTESAERKHDLAELEHAMLRDMAETKQARAGRFAVIVVSVIDGLSPLVAGFVVISPFLLPRALVPADVCYYISMGVALVLLFALGAFLAKIAKESIIRAGVRMVFAGLICVGLSFLLGGTGAH